MKYEQYVFLTIFSLILAACATATPATEIPAAPSGPDLIGTINRVSDSVHHNENQLSGIEDLFQNDSLRLFNGGEGQLDFGSDMRLRMFNDTELGGVRTTNDPGTPLVVKMSLFCGGFSGQLFREGGEAEFDTPNGARIHVFATTFIVAYDRITEETMIVNFEGDVRVEAAGSQLIPIRPGEIYQVQADEEPVLWGQVPWTPGEYEEQARTFQSALIPFESVTPVPVTGDETTVTPTDTYTPTQPAIEPTTPAPSITFTPTYTPTKTPIPCPPKLTVIQSAFCREGPSQIYHDRDSFLVGQVLEVEARNSDNSWWWVKRPTGGNCWISDMTVNLEGDSSCLPIRTPPPTYTPTPTPTLTATFCPMLVLKQFEAYDYPQRFVYWNAVGGCGSYSGTLTARYEGESSPYNTFQISSSSGTYDDYPPSRCEGTFNIVYTLTLRDGTGQEVIDSISMEITWIC